MADVTVTPATLEIVTKLHSPVMSSSFPTISRKPSHIFSDELSDEAVLIGDYASGYPLLNKLFTFDARTFIFEMPAVPEADKLKIMAHYESHKDKSFPWYNSQDHTWHEVIFVSKPGCRLDGRGDLWRIKLMLRQSSP